MRASAAAGDPQVDFEKYTLSNGLEVILHRDNRVPIVVTDVWYHVGSRDETYGKSGFAHLFEHMMFQGSSHVGEDQHFELLRKAGASNVNGSTSSERTNYYEEVPSNQIELALWLESDRMGWLLPLLNEKSMQNQIDVVRNERRQRYDNVPYGKDRFATNALLFPEGHPLRYLTIGRHEDIEHASVEDVKGFFRHWYRPANATLVIAGDFEPAEAKKLVEKWFGDFPKTEKPVRRAVSFAPLAKAERVEVQDPFAKLRRLHFVWMTTGTFQPGDAELDLLAHALGASGTGRLWKILVHDKQLVQGVGVSQDSAQHNFHVTVDLKSDADAAEVEKIVRAEIAKVVAEPIGKDELARSVISYEGRFIWGLEPLLARAELLQNYNQELGDPGKIGWDLDRYRAVTPEGIRDTAAKYLLPAVEGEIVTVPVAAPAGGAK